jgi:hypothetical protein
VIILASQAAIRVTVVVHLRKGAVIVVYYSVPISIGYPAYVLVVPSLSDLYNAFFPFPPYYDIDIRAGREDLVYTISRLLASNYSGNGRREGAHEFADFTKVVLPIDAYAEKVYFFLDKAF